MAELYLGPAAVRLKTTESALRMQIQRGRVKARKDGDGPNAKWLVEVPDGEEPDPSLSLIAELRHQIAHLEGEVGRQAKQIDSLHEELRWHRER